MLAQRILTALILIPLVVSGVLFLSTPVLALILGIVVLAGGLEWTGLATITSHSGRLIFIFTLGIGLWGLAWLLETVPNFDFMLSALSVAWWGLIATAVAIHKTGWVREAGTLLKALFGLIILWSAWGAIIAIHGAGADGPELVLFLMMLIWVADSGAYFSGRRWGRTKLAPDISPGKTREGVYGALVGAAACGLYLAWYRPQTGQLILLVLLCIMIALISVVGDLFESLMKRQAGIKDSGQLLPGHGGILDRIDSLTAAAPLFLLGLLLLEKAK